MMYGQILWGAEIMHKRRERDLALPNASEWLTWSSSLWHRQCSSMPKLWKSALLRFCVALSNKTGYKKVFVISMGGSETILPFRLLRCWTALMYEAEPECRSLLTCCRRSAVSVFLGYKLKPAAKKKLSCFSSKATPDAPTEKFHLHVFTDGFTLSLVSTGFHTELFRVKGETARRTSLIVLCHI